MAYSLDGFPITSAAQVTWYPPGADPYPDTYGYCADRVFADLRLLSEQRDPATPPTPNESFWKYASTSGIEYVPCLRGVTLSKSFSRFPSYPKPCDTDFTLREYYNENNTLEPWIWKVIEPLGYHASLYAPRTSPTTGLVKTQDPIPQESSVYVLYKLFTPPTTIDQATATYSGLRVYLGIQGSEYQYMLHLPNQKVEGESGSEYWTLYQGDTVVDVFEVPSRGSMESSAETKPEWLWVQNIAGGLLIRSSRMARDDAWYWQPSSPDPTAETGSAIVRYGYMAAGMWGCRGWMSIGHIKYASSASVQGPDLYYPDNYTQAATCTLNATGGYYDYSTSFTVADNYGHLNLTVTNNDRYTTPVLYSLQEIHELVLGTPAGGSSIDLTDYCRSISISVPEDGKGATASLQLENYTADDLKGMGKVVIELGHDLSSGATAATVVYETVYTGYATDVSCHRTGELTNEVSIECKDYVNFLEDGRTALWYPCFAGWDFKEAIRLALNLAQVEDDDVDLDDVADGLTIPTQAGSLSLTFQEDTPVREVIDRLCDLAHVTWYVNGDGKFIFKTYPLTSSTVAFTLSDSTTTPEDRIYTIDSSGSMLDGRSIIYGKGRDRWGWTVETIQKNYYMYDEDSPNYVGRDLVGCIIEEDNPAIGLRVQREVTERGKSARQVRWETLGRNLCHGDLVSCSVATIGVDAGTQFRITSIERSISAGDQMPVWMETYGGVVQDATG